MIYIGDWDEGRKRKWKGRIQKRVEGVANRSRNAPHHICCVRNKMEVYYHCHCGPTRHRWNFPHWPSHDSVLALPTGPIIGLHLLSVSLSHKESSLYSTTKTCSFEGHNLHNDPSAQCTPHKQELCVEWRICIVR